MMNYQIEKGGMGTGLQDVIISVPPNFVMRFRFSEAKIVSREEGWDIPRLIEHMYRILDFNVPVTLLFRDIDSTVVAKILFFDKFVEFGLISEKEYSCSFRNVLTELSIFIIPFLEELEITPQVNVSCTLPITKEIGPLSTITEDGSTAQPNNEEG
jgi:hypothetical protein